MPINQFGSRLNPGSEPNKSDSPSVVEAGSLPAAFSLVWSHVLGRGSLPLRPELPSIVYRTHERLTRRRHLPLHSVHLVL